MHYACHRAHTILSVKCDVWNNVRADEDPDHFLALTNNSAKGSFQAIQIRIGFGTSEKIIDTIRPRTSEYCKFATGLGPHCRSDDDRCRTRERGRILIDTAFIVFKMKIKSVDNDTFGEVLKKKHASLARFFVQKTVLDGTSRHTDTLQGRVGA